MFPILFGTEHVVRLLGALIVVAVLKLSLLLEQTNNSCSYFQMISIVNMLAFGSMGRDL